MLSNPKKIVYEILILINDALVNISLYGSQTYNFETSIIKALINYILSTDRFSDPLM